MSNETKHTTAQCKIVVYPWKELINNPSIQDDKLSATTRLDISSQILSCSFSKNIGSAAGNFSVTLTDSPGIGSQDWKDILKRGYWCLIYMSNDGDLTMNPHVGPNISTNRKAEARRLRGICYIERVASRGTTQDNRATEITYEVTGRDFGIVYEESNIWHNLFQFDKIMVDSMRNSKLKVVGNTRIDETLKFIHDLFYYPANLDGAKLNDDKSMLSIGLQWLLPREMLMDIGYSMSDLSRGTYWGALPGVKDFSETTAGIAVDSPTDFLSGNAWEQLRRLSIPQFHELFCETKDDGKPRLVFRPIPWSIDQSKYPKTASKIKLYKDLKPVVNVPAIDLDSWDVGEDDHGRYNSFLATISTSMINTEDNISILLGTGYPKQNKASIRRHGFRPMHVTIDSIVKNSELANGAANRDQLVEFNEVLYDYWNNAIFAETGEVTKVGTNDVKVGKVMKFNKDLPYLTGKRYYIEGYTDSYVWGENGETQWNQTVNLTRGLEEADLAAKKGFSSRNQPFSKPGEYTPRGGRK